MTFMILIDYCDMPPCILNYENIFVSFEYWAMQSRKHHNNSVLL